MDEFSRSEDISIAAPLTLADRALVSLLEAAPASVSREFRRLSPNANLARTMNTLYRMLYTGELSNPFHE